MKDKSFFDKCVEVVNSPSYYRFLCFFNLVGFLTAPITILIFHEHVDNLDLFISFVNCWLLIHFWPYAKWKEWIRNGGRS